MASKPTIANVEFATDATQSSGGQAGSAPCIDPGAATRKQGFLARTIFVARHLNYMLNQLYLWCVYLNDLHNSSAFLTQSYTFSVGTINFRNGWNAGASDQISATSVGHLALKTGNLFLAGETYYGDNTGTATPKSRTIMVPLDYGRDGGSTQKYSSGTTGLSSLSAQAQVRIPLTHFLRTDTTSKITRVRVGLTNNGAAVVAPTFSLIRQRTNTATGAQSTNIEATDATGTPGSTATGYHEMDSGVLAGTTAIDLTQDTWFLVITSSDNASGDVITHVKITWSDPGPRNN